MRKLDAGAALDGPKRQARRAQVAAGYVRRSTDRQEQSIPDQKKAVERFAQEQGLAVARFYVDDAISGTSVAGRRGFQQMLQDAQAPGCDFAFVIVYDVKRFGRLDNDEAGYYRHILKLHGVEVLYASENFSGDYTDDLLRPVKQWQARQESKDLSKVTIRGLVSKHENGQGVWLGGVPPHGYDLRYENDRGEFLLILRHMRDGTKQVLDGNGRLIRTLDRGESLNTSRRDRARLVPGEPARVATVRRIFELYTQEGRGLTAVSDWLNANNVPTPRGPAWSRIYCGQWADSTVRAILVNPIYAGDMVWNRRTDARFHKIASGMAQERRQVHGARLEPNDPCDWMIVRDAHPPLVSRRTFELAQRTREKKLASELQRGQPRPAGGWDGKRARFILSGLLVCGRCKHRFQGSTLTKSKPRIDGTKIKNHYYACGGYISRGKSVCQYRPIPQHQLEEAVIEALLKFYKDQYDGPEGRKRLAEAIDGQGGIECEDLCAARSRVHKQREQTEATIASLLDNLTVATRDLVEQRLATLRRQRDELSTREGELDRLALEQRDRQSQTHEMAKFLGSLEFTLRHGLPEEQKATLRQCVSKIHVHSRAAVDMELYILPRIDTSTTTLQIHLDPGSRPGTRR